MDSLSGGEIGACFMIKMKIKLSTTEWSRLKEYTIQQKRSYPEIIRINGCFEILLNNRVFLKEPDFPILEFLKYSIIWLNNGNKSLPMEYNSVETETNPLIEFIKDGEDWVIKSPVAKSECKDHLTREELEEVIYELVDSLMERELLLKE